MGLIAEREFVTSIYTMTAINILETSTFVCNFETFVKGPLTVKRLSSPFIDDVVFGKKVADMRFNKLVCGCYHATIISKQRN